MTPDLFDADLVALGEPTHGEHAFPQLRNHLFAELVERGFRSIALETDRVAALTADAFVQGEDVPWAEGFTHGFGSVPANRDLLFWMRANNAGRPPGDRLSFHGFDGPMELWGTPEADSYLRFATDFLGARVGPEDLLDAIYAAAPGADPVAWRAAEIHAVTGLALLRYHARTTMAEQCQVRDTLMARHLLDIRAHHGPTLVFAGIRHLQRDPSHMRLNGTDIRWTSAGAIAGAILGERYRVIAGSLGVSRATGEILEDRLRLSRPYAFVKPPDFPRGVPRAVPDWYFPLDAALLEHADALLHVPAGVDVATLVERILAVPGVEHQEADADHFFFVGDERRRPFATIVTKDVPDWDELSELNRPGVFRLNVDLGRREFERRFGFPPRDLPGHLAEFDFARTDEVMPHPSYGTAGWGSIVMPGPWRLGEVDELVAHARRRHT